MRKCGWEDGVCFVDFLENALEHWREFLVRVSDLRLYSVCCLCCAPLRTKGKEKIM